MAGLEARRQALDWVKQVLDEKNTLDTAFDNRTDKKLTPKDRALARAITGITLRRKGQIDRVLGSLMQKQPRKRGGSAMHILRVAAAQILYMETPSHAAVSLAVELAKADPKARHFSKLINGVLRSLVRQRETVLETLSPIDNMPSWLRSTWEEAYGIKTCTQMARSLSHEPYLDLSVRADPKDWASRLGGTLLPNGTVRLKAVGAVQSLEGFSEGAWWVQDMSATLPPALLGDVRGKKIADLCAAPGGKTAALVAAGSDVTAVDISGERLVRLKENLHRLKLEATVIESDILNWDPEQQFDAVLLDAPCSATGTARKHPDSLWLKTPALVAKMVKVQQQLLKRAVQFLKPGGCLVYATCSLQKEEGEGMLEFIERENLPLKLKAVLPSETFGLSDIIQANGTVRTLPHHCPFATDDPVLQGMDGFFIARFVRSD